MAVHFIPVDRNTPYILPASVQDYLPEAHLARFIVDIVDSLDLSALAQTYSGRGSQPYHPAMMVALLFYGYATGTFSSRKLEQATYDSIVYRYICANAHPDHDSINAFRKRFLEELEGLFVQILMLAQAAGFLKLGNVSLDGTKIKASASKHKALSWKYAQELEKQLQQEVEELLRLAADIDDHEQAVDVDIPDELARRETRLEVIRQAKAIIAARAQERYEQERSEYEAKVAKRQQYKEQTGKKPRGKTPQPPTPEPRDKDQVNLTDEQSRIMHTRGGSFEQSYNAQASVDIKSRLIVTCHVTQHANDKQEIAPTLEQIQRQSNDLGKPDNLLADAGYFSEQNVKAIDEQGITPLLSIAREPHNLPLRERLTGGTQLIPPTTDEGTDPVATMRYQLNTPEGKALYAQRKSTIEPTFGIIKHVQGFRQFLLRGIEAVAGEWSLVCMSYNLKRMFKLSSSVVVNGST
jgi:transposase